MFRLVVYPANTVGFWILLLPALSIIFMFAFSRLSQSRGLLWHNLHAQETKALYSSSVGFGRESDFRLVFEEMTFWIKGSNCSETSNRGVSSDIAGSEWENRTRSAISVEGGEETEIEGEASRRAGEGGGDSMVWGAGFVAAAIDILSIEEECWTPDIGVVYRHRFVLEGVGEGNLSKLCRSSGGEARTPVFVSEGVCE